MLAIRGFRQFLIPRAAITEPVVFRRSVHKDFRGPEWDLKYHRVIDTYDDGKEPAFARRTTERDRWEYYDQVVWRPEYHYPDGTPKEGEVFFVAENVKHSPLKLFYACQLVHGRSVDDADKQLQYLPKKAALILRQALKDAVDKAVNEHNIEYRSNLWIAECYATKSITIKGIRRHARERWGELEYVFSNLHIRLAEGKPPPYITREKPGRQGYSDGRKHLDELRSRRIKYGL